MNVTNFWIPSIRIKMASKHLILHSKIQKRYTDKGKRNTWNHWRHCNQGTT